MSQLALVLSPYRWYWHALNGRLQLVVDDFGTARVVDFRRTCYSLWSEW